MLAWRQGDYGDAKVALEESLALYHQSGDRRGIACALNVLGLVAQRSGDYSRAAALCDESLTLRRELGDKRGVALTLRFLGMLILHYGNHELCSTMFQESLTLRWELGDKPGLAVCLEGLAWAACGQRRCRKAARLIGAAENLRATIDAPVPPAERTAYEQNVAAIRADLGQEAYLTVYADGWAMSLEQAIAYALEEKSE